MTDTLTVSKAKEEAYEKWLTALKSGDYEQTQNALCRLKHPHQGSEGPKAYCCVGVLDEVVFETQWHSYDGTSILVDDNGEEDNISVGRVRFMDLDRIVSMEEKDLLTNYYVDTGVHYSRIEILAALNDAGVDFDTIAMLIEDTLKWDKE